MTAQEIVNKALENLNEQTQITGSWKPPNVGDWLDGTITLQLEDGEANFNVEIKTELRSRLLEQIENYQRNYPPFLLVAGKLLPKIKAELRQCGIAYLEANGNIYLRNNGTLLWIDTNKPLDIGIKRASRAFTRTGLKLVFQFLLSEIWINQPYRKIAEQTGISLGNIANIFQGLKQERFLIPVNNSQYVLSNKKSLLNEWARAYELRLKPTLKIGTFRFLKEEDFYSWKKIQLQNGKSWWGGESAADLLTGYLRPSELTIYTTETRAELIKNYRLIPDDDGKIKVYQKFWWEDEVKDNLVPPLLVYSDLIDKDDRRSAETAQKIYNDFLQDKL
jgi:hypothetical protein